MWAPVALAALAMFVVGVLDDRLQLSPLAKLVASLAIGAFLVFALAGTEPEGALPTIYTLVGTIWFAGICHAFNLLDNMDGLAAGVALIAAAFLALLLGPSLGAGSCCCSCRWPARCSGFCYWNRHPARLFMGDCGSLFIGAMLAAASLVPVFNTRLAFISPSVLIVLILVVPLFDTGFVLVLRRLAGRKASKGGTDHVSHRLVSLGFSERSAVRILYLLGLVGGGTAWVLIAFSGVEPMLPLVAVFGVVVMLVGIYLARVPAYNAEDFIALQKSSFAPFLKDLAFRWHAGEVMLDLVLITVCYYAAYRLRFEGEELDNFLALLHGVAAGRARVQAGGAVRVGPLPALVGDVRAARHRRRRPRRRPRALLRSVAAAYLYRLRGLLARRVRARRPAADVAIVATRASFRDDEPGGGDAQQAEPPRARLRRRRLRAAARARDARQHRTGT